MFFKKLLVPTDLSEPAEAAFQTTLSLVGDAPAEVTLLHVVDLSTLLPMATIFMSPGQELSLRREVRERVEQTMQELVAGQGASNQRVDTVVLEDKSVANAICRYAEDHNYDAIVISSHGRTGLAHMMIGSVAERVVRHAKRPVLVVPAAVGD